MFSESQATSFDAVVVPHLDAARRLARRLVRDEHDAEDAVQDALLRALRYFRTFGGGDGRAWFLRIVRNTCYGWYRKGLQASMRPFDEERHSGALPQSDPEALLIKTDDASSIARAMNRLPDPLHQLLVLRELEGLSYRELADVVGIPVGTVMSRLSRARAALRGVLDTEFAQPGMPSRPRRPERRSPPAARRRPASDLGFVHDRAEAAFK
jgi:RNA polymerase sigma-70 factor (ECF subfamily)